MRTCVPAILSFVLLGFAPASVQESPESERASHAGSDPGLAADATHERPVPAVAAVRASGSIELDGRLREAAWLRAPAATGFLQARPDEGEPATQRTEVRFLYDDESLYIGARMYDSEGRRGVRSRLVRRDAEPESDRLEVVLDTFHDHLGRTSFSVNPAGARGDALGLGGGHPDPSWDPVWEAATAVDSSGWTAEMRVPLSQLRFPADGSGTWGLQVVRYLQRRNEQSSWAFWRLNEQGGPSRYGHLTGLGLSGGGELEVSPYLVLRSSHVRPGSADDPLADPHVTDYRMGADLQYQLGPDLTLDATVNPDFGQVEVDPAVVNLSAFETFFPEKRPFFVRAAGLFDFGSFWCFFCNNASSLDLFFSRRIGRPPQGASVAKGAGRYVDLPENTTILGAARLSGRKSNGLSMGLMNALTRRESATVASADGTVDRVAVEPLTNYFVGRVKRDFEGGNLVVGLMGTSVLRDLESPGLRELLPRHAESLGMDAEVWWGGRSYHLLASAALTSVAGDSAAILGLQRSSARYFQRPDRENGGNGLFSDAYEPGATAMRGFGLYTRLAREAGDWRWEAAVNLRSPGLETNDIAFLTRTDFVWMNANVMREFTRPGSWYRHLMFIAGGQQQLNWDGDLTDRDVHAFAAWTTPFYWSLRTFWIRRPSTLDDRLSRGGPVLRTPGSHYVSLGVNTDDRKTIVVNASASWSRTDDGATGWNLGPTVRVKPASNVSLSLGPTLRHRESTTQYVTAVEDATRHAFYGRRYVFADLEQETVSLDVRADVTFTPTLSFQLFAQPFLASGDFSGFKEFERPREVAKRVYGVDAGSVRRVASAEAGEAATYVVDPDGPGPATEFSFADPDFNVRSLRGNAVLRWEYRPGSTLYLVWTQQRSGGAPVGNLDVGRDTHALFDVPPDNVFLVKLSYWLGL